MTLSGLPRSLANLDEKEVLRLVNECLSGNGNSTPLIEGLSKGFDEVMERYRRREYALFHLAAAGDITRKARALVDAAGARGRSPLPRGTVVLGTVRGDIHDMGKNIVGTVLSCAGYAVIDLGVDVSPDEFVRAADSPEVSLVGISILLATSYEPLRDTVRALKTMEPRRSLSVMIGGGSAGEGVKKYAGADHFGRTPVDAVAIAHRVYGATKDVE
ncbi:MAG: cobalamin-dependent protein [Deltaproteobacteria bacterium]|nr:cobalamin-dependent protein [Deltaproteobacteria bacterium]